MPLKEVLSRYVPQGTQIDFLSVDVEGMELQVLQSNDWNQYRPKIALIEQLTTSLEEAEKR